MNIEKISELKRKLDEMILEENVDHSELLSLSQKIDVLIVQEMKERIKATTISIYDQKSEN